MPSGRLKRELGLQAARFALGMIEGSDIVALAKDSVLAGALPDSVCVLATVREPHPPLRDVAPLFKEWLDEVGVAVPERAAAFREVLRDWISRIADGTVPPEDGVARLYQLSFDFDEDSFGFHDLVTDHHLRDHIIFEWRPHGLWARVAEHDRAIVDHAKEWLEIHRSR